MKKGQQTPMTQRWKSHCQHGPSSFSITGNLQKGSAWPSLEWIPFFCLHVSRRLDWVQISAYFMKSDKGSRMQLVEWKATDLISCGTSLPTLTPFKKTQIYIWIFHQQEHVPSRFVQITGKCFLDSDPENTHHQRITLTATTRVLTKLVPICGCHKKLRR